MAISWKQAALDLASPVAVFAAMFLGFVLGDILAHAGHSRPSDRREDAFIIAGVAVVAAIVSGLLYRYSPPRRKWWTEHILQSVILYPMFATGVWAGIPYNGGHIAGLFQTAAMISGAAIFTNGLVLLRMKWRDSRQVA